MNITLSDNSLWWEAEVCHLLRGSWWDGPHLLRATGHHKGRPKQGQGHGSPHASSSDWPADPSRDWLNRGEPIREESQRSAPPTNWNTQQIACTRVTTVFALQESFNWSNLPQLLQAYTKTLMFCSMSGSTVMTGRCLVRISWTCCFMSNIS